MFARLAAGLAFALPALGLAQLPAGSTLIVVTDETYPPYYFRDEQGRPHGIVVEKWALWSQKTGIPVRLEGREWSGAQQAVQNGEAHVIDPITRTAARDSLYEFSEPYASVEAAVYFHRSIPGISDLASLRGFAIGAKSGSACARWLTERGVEPRWWYRDSDSLVRAAGAGEVVLFCSDVPTANYFLHLRGLATEFRQAPALYQAQYHWAVPRGRRDLHEAVAQGFARISPAELKAIDDRWLGRYVRAPFDPTALYGAGAMAVALLLFALAMYGWNRTLRHRVAERTAELTNALALARESMARVEDLYNRAPCGYHSLDAGGRIVQVNDTELGWLQRTREEVVGRPLADFLADANRRDHTAHLAAVFDRGAVKDSEYEMVRKDGSTFPALISAVALRDEKGAFLMTRSTVYDITDRKRAEREIRRMNAELEMRVRDRTRDLENANRELASFTYTVSHDLRAPLRHIVAYLSMLEEDLRGALSEENRRHLDRARGAARRLDDLIYNLLDFARLGRAVLQHEAVRAGEVFEEARLGAIAEGGVGRMIEWEVAALPEVSADRALLRQVFANLLSNAVKFTRGREPAKIRAWSDDAPDDEIAFHVADNGAGFDMKHAGKLFGVFQRLHADHEFEGNGIGLAIVAQIVQRHGGRVWAESRPGEGTVVSFTLPRDPSRQRRSTRRTSR